MKRVDLTKSSEELQLLDKEVKKISAFPKLITFVFIIVLFIVFSLLFFRYNNKKEIEEFEKNLKFLISYSNNLLVDEVIEKDYVIVDIPSNDNNLKEISKYFKKGKLIIYKDSSIAFKVSNGTYCASKSFTDKSYKLYIFGNCLNYDIEKKNNNY